MKIHPPRLSAILLACVTPFAAAQDGAGETGPFRPGWYVAPSALYMLSDSARCNVNNGLGASLAFGHRGDFASLEIWGQFMKASHDGCEYTVPGDPDPITGAESRDTVVEPEGDVSLNGGGLGLVVGPFFEGRILSRLFGVVGFGVLQRQDHPHYMQSDTTIFGDAGVGYMQPLAFQLFGYGMNLRAEARYRYDVQQPPHPDDHDPAPPHAYQDIIVSVGLQIPLSRAPQPVAEAPAEVAVVAPVVTDADRDGVSDESDRCPGSRPDATVDRRGCETVTLAEARAGDRVVLTGVTFELNSDVLTDEAMQILNGVAGDLANRAELKIEIGGHTDDSGEDAYNQDLSQRRADAVMRYLMDQGIAADRMTAAGYGETQPVADNAIFEGRAQNRRVELQVQE